MFLDKWIPKKYLIKSTVCGVEVNYTDPGLKLFYTVLKKQGNKLQVVESGECDNVAALPSKLKKDKIPLVINVTGKGVILKKTNYNSEEEISSESFIQQNLPAINSSDFYVQVLKQGNATCFISVIRKAHLDALLKEANEHKFEIADVIIGLAGAIAINDLVAGYNYILAGTQRIELLNGNIETISANTETTSEEKAIDVDGLHIRSDYTLAFSAAFSYLTSQTIYSGGDTGLSLYRSTHLERNKTRTLLYTLVCLAFAICLLNFLFFSNNYSKNSKLQSELDLYQGKYEQINELLNSYEKKKSLIEQTGLLESGFLSKYSDRIASTIPDEVVLTEFYLNPQIKDPSGEDSLMNFEKNAIILKGNCHKSLIINEWVNVLKTQNFIKDVNLEKFSFNVEGNQPNFEVKILTE